MVHTLPHTRRGTVNMSYMLVLTWNTKFIFLFLTRFTVFWLIFLKNYQKLAKIWKTKAKIQKTSFVCLVKRNSEKETHF